MSNNKDNLTLIKIAKGSSFLFGGIMYILTYKSFGMSVSAALAVVFAVVFWRISRKEEFRIIGEGIVSEIKSAIKFIDDLDSIVEIRKMSRGFVARVYLINAKERVALFQKSITKRLESCKYKEHIWAMQLTDMNKKEEFKESRKFLDEELIGVLKKELEKDKKEKENKHNK